MVELSYRLCPVYGGITTSRKPSCSYVVKQACEKLSTCSIYSVVKKLVVRDTSSPNSLAQSFRLGPQRFSMLLALLCSTQLNSLSALLVCYTKSLQDRITPSITIVNSTLVYE